MDKVYLALAHVDNEGYDVVAICKSREGAEAALETYKTTGNTYDRLTVEEYNLYD